MNKSQIFCLSAWILLAGTCITTYCLSPERFTPEAIRSLVIRFGNLSILIYLVIHVLRAFSGIPSTPFIVAGTMIFPDSLLLIFFMSIVGIASSAVLVYTASHKLDINEGGNLKKRIVSFIKKELEKKTGWLFIVFCGFTPLIPSDLVCVAAGAVKMNSKKFLSALLVGETIICITLIYYSHIISSQITP